MKEDVLHFIWKHKRFTHFNLETTAGESIKILSVGQHNHDSGPDFSQARIKIGEKDWAGHVEIHINASDWYAHNHQNDKAYDSVILHVVYVADKVVKNTRGAIIPTLEIKQIIDSEFLKNHVNLSQPYQYIPCEKQVAGVHEFEKTSYMQRLMIERLEEKTHHIKEDYLELKSNLSESFYRLLAKGFGQKTNLHGFDMLTRILPLHALLKQKDKLVDLEAMVFGVSGYLSTETKDAYHRDLKNRFLHLKQKFQLSEMKVEVWKSARMRPNNFPVLRLAQFAATIHKADHFIELLEMTPNHKKLMKLLRIKTSKYWDTHFQFGVESPQKEKWLGNEFIRHLLINVFVPFYFFYKRRTGNASVEIVEDILSNLPPEKNNVTGKMEQVGFRNTHAMESQSLYHLYNRYCTEQKCLNCNIGFSLLKSKKND